MNKNMGSLDRLVRIVLGLGLLSLTLFLDGSMRWVGLIGVVPLLTATVRICPLYSLVGLNTDRTPRQ
ncbi:MAG: DUF2892 domain-containing protein [Pseudomonadota bacterium]